ncbi:MAG: polysaccharide biosynthesis protein [Clostridia bacterium]|nr:polysaccharide biosynthesis protein [Clostridia bacterium]MDH7572172.1 polysaccharide biosynthesis protein [Clostridia bacterium]
MARSSLAGGVAALFAANLFSRILGFAYRAMAVRLIGAEGMGLYQMVFPVYGLVLVITTAGLPLALARVTAEARPRGDYGQIRRAFAVTAAVLTLAGVASVLAVGRLVPVLSQTVLPDPRTQVILSAAVPALMVVPVASAFRGLFQGLGRLDRPAQALMVEQVARVAVGLYLAARLLPRGLAVAAAGLATGMVVGEAAGLAYLLSAYAREKPWRNALPPRAGLSIAATWHRLWQLGWPITLGRVVASVTLALEAVLIPQRLQAGGYGLRQATELYGQFSGVAMALLTLPTVFTLSLAAAAVPGVAEAAAGARDRLARYRIRETLRLTLVGGLPFAVAYLLFPHHLAHFLFGEARAGDSLRLLALGAVFVYLQQSSTGILQGLGRPDLATRHSVLGAVVLLVGIYWLTVLPGWGIAGAAAAVVASALVGCALNLRSITRLSGSGLTPADWVAALAAASAMIAASAWAWRRLAPSLTAPAAVAAALLLGAAVYVLLALALGALSRQDLARLFGMLGRPIR